MFASLLAASLIACSPAGAVEATPVGRLGWIVADDLDLVGDLGVRFAESDRNRPRWFGSLDLRTAIERTESEFTFRVRQVEYRAEAGRGDLRLGPGKASVSLLRWGRRNVDAPGRAHVTSFLLGLGTPGYSDDAARPGWHWRVQAGPVVEERDVDADAVALARVRWVGPEVLGAWRLGLDGSVDALVGGPAREEDLEAGVRLLRPLPDGRAFSLFVRGLRARSPLGTRVDAAWVGFAYAEVAAPIRRGAVPPPDISGEATAGGGGGREAARLLLTFRSPDWRRWHAVASVDANLVTARDADDLYYLYDVGIASDRSRWRVGGWFYHRSNHVLAKANGIVTSINVFETGIETLPDRRIPWLPPGIDLRARVGWLASSRFGEDRRWHARGAVRWTAPRAIAGWTTFAELEYEAGDVARRIVSAGARRASGLVARLEHRDDDQWFARDRTAWLALVGVAF